jgi:hypothetical protein
MDQPAPRRERGGPTYLRPSQTKITKRTITRSYVGRSSEVSAHSRHASQKHCQQAGVGFCAADDKAREDVAQHTWMRLHMELSTRQVQTEGLLFAPFFLLIPLITDA